VPTVVPLTMILTPGMGEPSAADVTCPVTMNCCNRLGVSKPVANDTFHAKIRASNVILWVECFMVRNFFAAGLEKGNMYDLLKVDSFLSKIQTREEDFFKRQLCTIALLCTGFMLHDQWSGASVRFLQKIYYMYGIYE